MRGPRPGSSKGHPSACAAEGFAALVHSDLAFIVGEGFGNLVSTLTAAGPAQQPVAIFHFLQHISTGLVIVMYVAVLVDLQARLALMAVVAIAIISWLVKGAVTRSRALGAETTAAQQRDLLGDRGAHHRHPADQDARPGGPGDDARSPASCAASPTYRSASRSSAGVIEVTIDPLLMLTVFVIIYVGVEYFSASLATLGLFLFILLRLNQKAKDFNGQRQVLSSLIDSLISVHTVIERAMASRTIVGGIPPSPACTRASASRT